MTDDEAAAQLMKHRPMLFGLAYRMLGSAHDADDVLQNAYMRWSRVDRRRVLEPQRYLTRLVTTTAIDLLRQRRARRESYIGPWLPEPIMTQDLADCTGQRESLSFALLHLMEHLTPAQRAVFILRSAFELPYADIAEVLDRPEATCRQWYRRAVAALPDGGGRRFSVDRERHRQLLNAFLDAAQNGELPRLERLLCDDVVSLSDGGGLIRVARRPVLGRSRVARFFGNLYGRPSVTVASADFNGTAGAVVTIGGQPHVLLLGVIDDRIGRLYVVANPDKLTTVLSGFG